MKRIKVRTLIKAIRKNGYPKARGSYQKYIGDDIIGYCAFGQAGMNLGVRPAEVRYGAERVSEKLAERIIDLNDNTAKSIPEIADIVEKEFSDLMNEWIILYGIS